MSEPETCTFEQLAAWSKSRLQADQCDASDNIMLRAIALVEKKTPDKTVVRDEATGDLVIVDKKKPK